MKIKSILKKSHRCKKYYFCLPYLKKIANLITHLSVQLSHSLPILFYYSLWSWGRAVRNACLWLALKDKYVSLINMRSSFGSMKSEPGFLQLTHESLTDFCIHLRRITYALRASLQPSLCIPEPCAVSFFAKAL